MKLLHLSDLHIGKRVHETSMLEDQQFILLRILQIIDQYHPDAILIAGDVYDKTIPSAEAVTLLDDFLYRLSQRQIPVMMISGNHDSPERLAFGGRMLEQSHIHISPVYSGRVEPICLEDCFGPVDFWLLPFLKPVHVRRCHPEQSVESYTDACRVALEQLPLDPARRNVLLTHQFVTGAATCESEELSVGGSDNVDASIFDAFDYVALGHIHGPQNIGSNRIRYCGTPLKYSFSEASHHKSVTLVHLNAKGDLSLELIPLTPLRDMRQLRGSFQDLSEGQPSDDYLHLILTDEEDVPEAVGKLRVIYPNLLKLSYDNTRTRTNQTLEGADDVAKKTPLELFDDLYQLQNNQPMSPQQRQFVQQLLDTMQEVSL